MASLYEKLLAHYKLALDEMPKENTVDALKFLEDKYMDLGVCYCAEKLFCDSSLYDSCIGFRFGTYRGSFWAETPSMVYYSIDKMIAAVKARIEILEQLVTEAKAA